MADNSASGEQSIVDSRGRPVSWEVANELNMALLTLRPVVVAERMWQRLFTEEDRQRLGSSLEACWPRLGTIRMWMQARGVSMECAIIDVAHGLGVMSDSTASWLLRELDLEPPPPPPGVKPSWDAETGKLRLGDRVIRRVRMLKKPSNIQQILDAFQAARWRHSIGNPLPRDQQQLHQALRSLNKDLKMIVFRSKKRATAIAWERR